MTKRLCSWTLAIAFGLGQTDSLFGQAPTTAPAATSDLAGFKAVVVPFVQQYCVKCHGPELQKGKLTLHNIDGNVITGPDVEKWTDVLERLALNEMPPESEKRPDAEQSRKVISWIKLELHKAGVDAAEVDRKLILPGHGNRVDHTALFSGEFKGPAYSPGRLWRMSPHLYEYFIPRITGNNAKPGSKPTVSQPYSPSPAEGFKDFSGLFTIDQPTINTLIRNAKRIVEIQTTKTTLGKTVPELAALVNPDHQATDNELKAAIRKEFQMALQREPTASETERFMVLMRKNIETAGQPVGVRMTLATILMLPEGMYRQELGAGTPDEHGRRLLAPRELANAIAYALTDSVPDAKLLAAADSGKLGTKQDVEREVKRLLDDRSIAKPRIPRFFEEYFEYPEAEDVFKDFPRGAWRPEIIINDTRLLIEYILEQDKDVLKELLTTNKSFVNCKKDAAGNLTPARLNKAADPGKPRPMAYSDLYNLPLDWTWTDKQPIELPKDQRAGILTQPSWLAAYATNNETHAIRRGKWVRERLLGNVVPDVPISVDAKLPDTPDKSIRERMKITTAEYCWQCHQKMNNLGLTFEMFDFVGQFRTTEKVVDLKATAAKKGKLPAPAFTEIPLDTSGSIDRSGEPKLDGSVKNAVEMMHKLAASDRVRQVFVRHAFRYWMGRNESLVDSPTLMAADKAYVASGGSMKALITSLLTSDSFLYRKDEKSAAAIK